MALADSKFDVFVCSVFNLNNKNVNALIAHELLGFTCIRSLTMNSRNFSFIVSELVSVSPDDPLAECINLDPRCTIQLISKLSQTNFPDLSLTSEDESMDKLNINVAVNGSVQKQSPANH